MFIVELIKEQQMRILWISGMALPAAIAARQAANAAFGLFDWGQGMFFQNPHTGWE
jgi:hypothetical protein